jgi:hypothetical protein
MTGVKRKFGWLCDRLIAEFTRVFAALWRLLGLRCRSEKGGDRKGNEHCKHGTCHSSISFVTAPV